MGPSDKIRLVSSEQVEEHLAMQLKMLHSLLATIQTGFERNNRTLALFNLGYRTIYEVGRIKERLSDRNEQLAWSVRNLCELHLVLCYVIQSEKNLSKWLGQMPSDEKDILEGFLVLGDRYNPEDKAKLKSRLETLEAICAKHGMEMKRPWRMSELAKATGTYDEYQLFYKFYSKFVHPSSWLVNGRTGRINSPMYKSLLVGLAQVFAQRNFQIILKELNLDEDHLLKGALAVPWETPL